MSVITDNDKNTTKQDPAQKGGFKITPQQIVIGLLVLSAGSLLLYQMFGCEGCYVR